MAKSRRGKGGKNDPRDPSKVQKKRGEPSASRNRKDGYQNPRTSGTIGLGGEPKDSESIREPGGVEGTRDSG